MGDKVHVDFPGVTQRVQPVAPGELGKATQKDHQDDDSRADNSSRIGNGLLRGTIEGQEFQRHFAAKSTPRFRMVKVTACPAAGLPAPAERRQRPPPSRVAWARSAVMPARSGEDLVRISTHVRTDGGSPAIGMQLDPNGPVMWKSARTVAGWVQEATAYPAKTALPSLRGNAERARSAADRTLRTDHPVSAAGASVQSSHLQQDSRASDAN